VRGIDAFDALDADPTPALAPPPRTPAIAAAASPAAATTTAMCSASGERQPRPLSSGEAPERGEDIFCHPCRSSCAPNPLDALDLADTLDLAAVLDLADALDSSDTSAALAAPDAPSVAETSQRPVAAVNERPSPRPDWLTVCGDISSATFPTLDADADNDAPPRLRGTFARLTLADAWVNCTMMALVPKHSLLQGALRQTGWKPGEGDTRSHGLRAARAAARATGASHD
jgi:hypothetical protein